MLGNLVISLLLIDSDFISNVKTKKKPIIKTDSLTNNVQQHPP